MDHRADEELGMDGLHTALPSHVMKGNLQQLPLVDKWIIVDQNASSRIQSQSGHSNLSRG